ncbi:unnamed protein product [Polarella glacialis]|uniref:Uncharacterized protein n=1 Tax=Polarella glacialis TaxID=89957 RepID=A0A813FI35_POLGL|nr:unnamed protein product [Polarella glacialis]CAE8619900.1 unnamed protein product [Polarella glacialis]
MENLRRFGSRCVGGQAANFDAGTLAVAAATAWQAGGRMNSGAQLQQQPQHQQQEQQHQQQQQQHQQQQQQQRSAHSAFAAGALLPALVEETQWLLLAQFGKRRRLPQLRLQPGASLWLFVVIFCFCLKTKQI